MILEHEKHVCHDAAVRAKHKDMWRVEPTSVPLFAGLRCMEEVVFLKISSYMLDVHTDAQR